MNKQTTVTYYDLHPLTIALTNGAALRVVTLALAVHAREYGPAGGRVTVSARRNGHMIRVTATNTDK